MVEIINYISREKDFGEKREMLNMNPNRNV